METGFLPGIFRFNRLGLFSFFIFVISAFGLGTTGEAYAIEWFSVYGSGVLSGGDITNNGIPNIPPTGFNKDVVQHPGSENITTYGSLISSGGQTTNGDDDAYVKNLVLTPKALSIDSLLLGATNITDCSTIFNNRLNPNILYKISGPYTASCLSQSFIADTDRTYGLESDGLVIIAVDFTSGLNLRKTLKSTSSNQRILLLTNSTTSIVSNVGTPVGVATFDTQNQYDLAMITTSTFTVQDSATLTSILEGPLISGGAVTLGRNYAAATYPGVFVKYNPFYVAELSKKGTAGLAIKGLLESKTTWRYD